jgi:T-complex protein 1 subunit delta
MLNKGLHPTIIAEAFLKASAKAVEYLTEISVPVNLDDNAALLRAATTSLSSKVISLTTLETFIHANGETRLSHNIRLLLLRLLSKLSAVSSPKPPPMLICETFALSKKSVVPLRILS